MEEEQTTEETTSENSTEGESSSKKSYIVFGIIGAIVLGLIGLFALYSSGNEQAQEIVTPIIKVISPDYSTPTPTSPPQAAATTISGTVTLKDAPPARSAVAIAVREKNKNSYIPIETDLKAVDGVKWSWNQAISGVAYDVQAYLVTNIDTLVSNSQPVSATAPKSAVELTIDFAELPSPPNGSLTVACKSNNGDKWSVSYAYNINNPTSLAKQYRLLAGVDTVGTLVWDETFVPSSPDTTQSTVSPSIFEQGKQYFGSYAYATCESCTEFSKVSEWVAFKCEAESTSTPTPTPVDELFPN